MIAESEEEAFSPEAIDRIREAADEIVDVCECDLQHPSEALNALSAALAYMLSMNVISKEAAVEAIQVFANSTLMSINAAEEDGNCAWQASKH